MPFTKSDGETSYWPQTLQDLQHGSQLLQRAFDEARTVSVGRDTTLIVKGDEEAGPFQITRGFAYRSAGFSDGRRAILDVLVPGDIAGLECVVKQWPEHEIVAVNAVGGKLLGPQPLHDLLRVPGVALWLFVQLAEACDRMDRVAARIARCDARERIAAFLLDIYDRLRRRELISGNTFNLPLTQEQIGDHLGLTMVHVNRTLRLLREEGLVLAGRGVVVVIDDRRLRAVAGMAEEITPSPPNGSSVGRAERM